MRTATLLLALALAAGCDSKVTTSAASASVAPHTAAAPPPAPPPPAEAPELAAIHAGKWRDPSGGPDIKLAEQPIKCFGFDGYSIKAPEGSTMSDVMDARCCKVVLPGAKQDAYRLVVCSDELPVPWLSKTRDQVEKVKTKLFDEPDAFLYEVDAAIGTSVMGWYKKTIGPHGIRCNAVKYSDDEHPTFAYQRAVIELCRTIAYKGK